MNQSWYQCRRLEREVISVCWNKKTDSQLVAISNHDSQDNTRKIRFFKGEYLENVATSRTEDGSGNLFQISWLMQILLGPDQTRQTCLLAFSEKDAREGILYSSSRMGFSTAASNWSIDLITKRLFDWIGTLKVTYVL